MDRAASSGAGRRREGRGEGGRGFTTPQVWETHGIHVGTGADHVSHGIDDLDGLVERALELGLPALTFIIHTPRLTRFRYASEKATDVKFIRGDSSYFTFAARMHELRRRHTGAIRIRFGVELEWLGAGLGMQWSRSKLFQAPGLDFVVGSLHFSPEGIPYDGTREEAEELVRLRGGLEELWAGYFQEMIEMVDACASMVSVIGHLDLPKLHVPLPRSLQNLEEADDEASHRLFTLLEMIAERSLALDVNLSGLRRGVGIYPDIQILRRAHALGIPVAMGSDCHSVEDLGSGYPEGIRHLRDAGYRSYVSFTRGIPEKRSLGLGTLAAAAFSPARGQTAQAAARAPGEAGFSLLNLGIEMLGQRFDRRQRLEIPHLSFGGELRILAGIFPDSSSLGSFHALRVRRRERSLTLSDAAPDVRTREITCLYSHHADTPGTLAVLLNTLASEEINVETAWLHSLDDGTATAYLTIDGPQQRITEAVDFVLGTAADRFFTVDPASRVRLPPLKQAPAYLLELDGVGLPLPISRHMIVTVHSNRPGVLLVLLSALAARGVNVVDLQLGARGDRGFAVLGIQGEEREVADVLTRLGPEYMEASHIVLTGFEEMRLT
jgi:HisJ family histidinol phosphate phosphatase